MQSKMYSAALAALVIASVDAAAVSKRQLITFQPGSIVGPVINMNYGELQSLSAEGVAYKTLDEIRLDLVKTGTLVTQLNKASSVNAEDKKAQANAIVTQVQSNAENIRSKLTNLTSLIQGKIPVPSPSSVGSGVAGAAGTGVPGVGGAGLPPVNIPSVTLPNPANPSLPGVPAVGVPAVGTGLPGVGGVPAVGTPAVPALPVTTSVAIGTIGGVVDRLDALVSQAHTLNNQARTQVSLMGSFLETLLTPLLGQTKSSSARDVANSFKTISSALESLFGVLSTLSVNGLGTAPNLVSRIADARVNINPALVAGISADVTV